MIKRIIYLLIWVLISVSWSKSYAQNSGVALDLGYKYNKRSQFYLGASFAKSIGRPNNSMGDPTLLFGAGGGASIGSFNGQTKIIPTAHLSAASGGVMLIEGKVAFR